LGEHDFVAFRINAEGEVDLTVFFLWFFDESAAVGFDEFDSGEDVIALEAEAGPDSFAFAATVDTNCGAT